jgi:putative aldouronate transport system permease protein
MAAVKKRRKRVRWSRELAYQIVIHITVGLIVLICIYPLINIVSGSLMSAAEWNERGGVFLFPHMPTLDAYRVVLRERALYWALLVSVERVLVGPVTGAFVNCVTGYALSRKRFCGKSFISVFIFITMVYVGGLIPNFLVTEATGLLDTFWVYIIPGLLGAWGTLVFRQTFQNTPPEIEEAAKVDGASELVIMARIMVPINMPTVAVMLLFGAVAHWNAWFDAFMYVDANNTALIPLQLYLKNAFSASDESLTGVILHTETQKMVIAMVGIVPILCIYPFFQKHFTKGVYTGAVKG